MDVRNALRLFVILKVVVILQGQICEFDWMKKDHMTIYQYSYWSKRRLYNLEILKLSPAFKIYV